MNELKKRVSEEIMGNFLWILIIIVAVIVFLAILKTKKETQTNDEDEIKDEVFPFFAKKTVLSQVEQILYWRLIKALPDHVILAQVQLSQLLGVKSGENYSRWNNRINRMSCDFVVCNKDSSIIAVIELDDATHQRKDRQAADAKKDKALNSANVRIVRWQAKSLPDEEIIKSTFANSKKSD